MTQGAFELARRYSAEEIDHFFEQGRLWLRAGQIRKAEIIMHGLNEVAPQYSPAWLGSAYIAVLAGQYDAAVLAARHAMKAEPESVEAMLMLAACLITIGDANTAGTYLGEVGERIELGKVTNPVVHRLYRMQLARFQPK